LIAGGRSRFDHARVDHLVASERFARQLSGVPDLGSRPRQEAAMRALWERSGRPVVNASRVSRASITRSGVRRYQRRLRVGVSNMLASIAGTAEHVNGRP
jgi:hypothetical protein